MSWILIFVDDHFTYSNRNDSFQTGSGPGTSGVLAIRISLSEITQYGMDTYLVGILCASSTCRLRLFSCLTPRLLVRLVVDQPVRLHVDRNTWIHSCDEEQKCMGQKYLWLCLPLRLYSDSLSSGSDVSMQTQLLNSLFLCAREPVCAISLGAHDLALHLAN